MLSASIVSSRSNGGHDTSQLVAKPINPTNRHEQPSDGGPAIISYELEIEILDAPALIAEGHKEERGEPNRFDEILQSCLDTVRMLVRNVG